jgi:hypothetical protein
MSSFRSLGFEVWQTGGGCQAWGRTLPDGTYIMATDPGGAYLPERETLVCVYDKDGNEQSVKEYPTIGEALRALETGPDPGRITGP